MKQKYDIFISYRREGGDKYARTIQLELEKKYSVFLDFDELKDGVFDQRIMNAIQEAPIFLLVLSRGALDRCVNENDWVRKEILYASECNSHIVPVVIVDDAFEGIPENLPQELKGLVGAHQFSEIQMKTLFKASMEELIRNRIAPYLDNRIEGSGAEIHIETDSPCSLYCFKDFVKDLQPNTDNVVYLNPGTYKLSFISTQFPDVKVTQKYTLDTGVFSDFIEVGLGEKVILKQKEVEEQKRQAEELFKTGNDYFLGQNNRIKDPVIAAKCYLKAAALGHAKAQNMLGYCYEHGLGVVGEPKEAVKWYLKAAEQGLVIAQFYLGNIYFFGNGVPNDFSEAVKWYQKAANQGHAKSQFMLGYCYYNDKGVSRDLPEAVKWYLKAAEQGYAEAQSRLGYCYYYGEGVSKDYTEAVKWYKKAAEQGHAEAQSHLGSSYYFGEGVPIDYTEAAKWFRKATEKGNYKAQYFLGICYYFGKGVNKDILQAKKLLQESSDQGNQYAKVFLKKYYSG